MFVVLGFAEVGSNFEGCYADSIFDRVFTDTWTSYDALTASVKNGCGLLVETFLLTTYAGRASGRSCCWHSVVPIHDETTQHYPLFAVISETCSLICGRAKSILLLYR